MQHMHTDLLPKSLNAPYTALLSSKLFILFSSFELCLYSTNMHPFYFLCIFPLTIKISVPFLLGFPISDRTNPHLRLIIDYFPVSILVFSFSFIAVLSGVNHGLLSYFSASEQILMTFLSWYFFFFFGWTVVLAESILWRHVEVFYWQWT